MSKRKETGITKQLIALAVLAITLSVAQANPDERAQLCKAQVLAELTADNWQLVNETHSLLQFQKVMSGGWRKSVVQVLTSGNRIAQPTYHLQMTFIPKSDHATFMPANLTLQSGFENVPITSNDARDYINGIVARVSAELPAKYRFHPAELRK